MTDILDKAHAPDISELSDYIANPLFDELYAYLGAKYHALYDVVYSGDNVLLGWNIRFYKAGKTLCRLYPRKGGFAVLAVVGRKEKPQVEALLMQMSPAMQELYARTQEGMGQRWLLLELSAHDALYDDLLTLIDIRKASK